MPTVWAARFSGLPFCFGTAGGPNCRKECKMMKGYLNSCRTQNDVFEVLVQGCTLRCAYCDRPACWEKEKAPLVLTAEELFEKLGQSGAKTVLVAGGEPDTLRMARALLDEFRAGKLGRITLELPGAQERNDG